jgi:outer membrane protein assembly factor BamA
MLTRQSYRLSVAMLVFAVREADAQTERRDSVQAPTAARGTSSTAVRILPVIGSAPETGFMGGATALRVSTRDSATRPSTDQVYAAYTAKQQFRAFVSTDRWSSENQWGVNAQLEYLRFPQPYYGVGIDAPEGAEEWYEARSWIGGLTIRRRIARAVYAQLGFRYSDTKIGDFEEGGLVAAGDVLGSRGGAVSQLIAGGAWDTRDNLFAPTTGSFAHASVAHSDDAFGADHRFTRYTGDARRYWRLGRGVLAGQAYVEATTGNVPFDQLALVGSGSVMRGYARGRFRDRDLAAAQIEYRAPIVGRLGAALFAGGGTVAPTIGKLGSSSVLPSFGGGARWLLLPKQGTTVRVDYGMGTGSSGLYIAFNEAF